MAEMKKSQLIACVWNFLNFLSFYIYFKSEVLANVEH